MANTKEIEFESQNISTPWKKFFLKLKDIDDPIFKNKVYLWKPEHILGYICKRFKELYNKEFCIVQKNAPSKCSELFFIKRMIQSLNTSDMILVKKYVDWIYDTKIIPENKKIRTLAYFMTPGFCNEFHFEQAENEIIKRSSIIPQSYKQIAESLNISISTYGELAFIKMAAERTNDLNNPNVLFIKRIQDHGFELSILEKLAE